MKILLVDQKVSNRRGMFSVGKFIFVLAAASVTCFVAEGVWAGSPRPAVKGKQDVQQPFFSVGSARKEKEEGEERKARPRNYRSRNFLVHTDLPKEEAQDLLKRLETMLSLISRYWGRPNRKIIECYVVKDLDNWPLEAIHPTALDSIRGNAGLTMSKVLKQGNRFRAKATVYAVADRGTPQHEAVHAYCSQAFGTTGPTWYSEGMAEMGQYWRKDDSSVHCHEVVVEYIRKSEPKSLNEIVNGESYTGDSWQNYAWRWALCHLLANNTNYQKRFRPLGLGLLTGQNVSFEKVYGPMAKEISFEYLFFLEHLDQGYRADLCSWDWETKFVQPRGSRRLTARIEAQSGWQASRLRVAKGVEYEYAATGKWRTEKKGNAVDADGDEEGRGRLMGVIFDDDEYELGKPFELGVYGSFKAPSEGNVYLRCQDAWNEIADNSGELTVKLKEKDSTSRLRNPKEQSSGN